RSREEDARQPVAIQAEAKSYEIGLDGRHGTERPCISRLERRVAGKGDERAVARAVVYTISVGTDAQAYGQVLIHLSAVYVEKTNTQRLQRPPPASTIKQTVSGGEHGQALPCSNHRAGADQLSTPRQPHHCPQGA